MVRKTLLFYAALFAAVGLAFVAAEATTLRVVSWAGAWAGCAALAPGGPSLWLGLTGSLMAVIAWLSYRLSQDPEQPAAWEGLLLSKAASASLFLAFAARARQPLFAGAAGVDAFILGHLAWMRRRLEEAPGLAPRLAAPRGVFHEAWFARFNDPSSGRAAWIRYATSHESSETRLTLYDPADGRVVTRRAPARAALFQGPTLSLDGSELSCERLRGAADGASWDVAWSPGRCPPAPVVPAWVRALGLSRSGYDDAAPAARFSGRVVLDGEAWEFEQAPGCLGHVWGERYGQGWWWAHAAFPEQDAVLELLSAGGRLGARLTSAALWRGGRLLLSSGPLSLVRNASRREGDRWIFRAHFPGVTAQGECTLGPEARVVYEEPPERRLLCRNSKISALSARLRGAGAELRLSTTAAAVEFVEPQ